MKRRIHKKILEHHYRNKDEPASPLWVRLLWAIGILSFCGIAWWRMYYVM